MIVDIIDKKRLGLELETDELKTIFNGYLKGDVPDYQMSSLLMAICINGMSEREIFDLTKIFIDSGEVLDFSSIPGIKVDKHSTGGIGDKTTLVIVPIVASLKIPVVKMSGRGLGYTGGTIDKLESIPGFRTNLSDQEIFSSVSKVGAVITSQTKNLVALDKMVYALRDVTATVSSIPLIAVSIMSKKIASGADKIMLDVKYGNGALIHDKDDALKLAQLMKKIGEYYGREVRYILSDMNMPLGYNIGNSLEVIEAAQVLKNNVRGHLFDVCVELASNMVSMGKNIDLTTARKMVIEVIENGDAYNKFIQIVTNQGGNISSVKISNKVSKIISPKNGVVEGISAIEIGKISLGLGAGRKELTDKIDFGVGISLNVQIGDKIKIKSNLFDADNEKGANETLEVEIKGIFDGHNKSSVTSAQELYENTLITDLDTAAKVYGNTEDTAVYQDATFFVKGDKNLDQVIKNIKKLDINWKQYNLIKSSTNYPALQQSISGIYSIANKLFAASLIFAGITVSLLLLLWMNARKKEIAIFLSLGISKLKIFGQFVVELVFISIPAYIGSYFLALYTGNMIGNNILNKVTGNITKQIAKQSASSGLGGGAEVDGFNKTLTSLDINILPKSIIYVILFMSLVLIISLVLSSISSLKKNPKELLIDTK